MKYLRIVFIFLSLVPTFVQAKKSTFIEAHLLRISSQTSSMQWLLPFHQTKRPMPYEVNLLLSKEKDTYSLYKDIESKDQNRIEDTLQSSFGKPYDASAKLNVGYRTGAFSQFFSTNGGAVLLISDPVFPELKGFLFHDYTATTAYLFRPHPYFIIKPQISYGVRRVLDKSYTVGDLVERSLDVNFNKAPYIGFVEFNLQSTLSLRQWGQVIFHVNSYPITKNDYQYWDTFLGYRTPNFMNVHLYGGYSPFYGGDYDVSRTYKLGGRIALGNNIGLDIFTMDDFYFSSILSFDFTYASVNLFTFERAFDDFGNQKSRDYGFNLKATW